MLKTEKKLNALKKAATEILNSKLEKAKSVIVTEYPFAKTISEGRHYTDRQKMEQFVRDGFIDRYSGQKLINPGLLKVLSFYLPDDFPYHAHWKMNECHNAYWEFIPTVDHVYPVALGGADSAENWVTTSMLHNMIKSNWTLEQLQWELYDAGDFQEWDGLTDLFLKLVEANKSVLKDSYIKKWYNLSKNIFTESHADQN